MPFTDEYPIRGVPDEEGDGQQYDAVMDEQEPAYRDSWERFEEALNGDTPFPALIQPYNPDMEDGVHRPDRAQVPTSLERGYGIDIRVPERVDADRFGALVETTWDYTTGLDARASAASLARSAREGVWSDAVAALLFGPRIVGSAAIHTLISRVTVPEYRCGYHVGDHEVYVHLYTGEEYNTINIQGEPYNDHRPLVLKHLSLHDGNVDDAAEELSTALHDHGIAAPESI